MRYEIGGYTDAEVVGGGGLSDPTRSTGTLQFTSVPAAGDTVTLDTEVFTFNDTEHGYRADSISNSTKLPNRPHVGKTPEEAIANLHAVIARNPIVSNLLIATIKRGTEDTINFAHRHCGDNNSYITTNTVTGAVASGATLSGGTNAGAGRFRPCQSFIARNSGQITVYIPAADDVGQPHYDNGPRDERCPTGKSISIQVTSGVVYPLSISGSSAAVTALY